MVGKFDSGTLTLRRENVKAGLLNDRSNFNITVNSLTSLIKIEQLIILGSNKLWVKATKL